MVKRLVAIWFAIAVLFLASGISAAACPIASRTITVPAVVSDQEGGLLHIEAMVRPGNGMVYMGVDPLTGASTQMSAQMAAQEAFSGLNVSEQDCDVEFTIGDDGQSQSVDGPSAGLAMTVALRAALTDATLRDDVIITGAIGPGGQVGEVGGLIDKAQASARNGATILLTPRQQIYEGILLRALAERYNFTAIEVQTLGQAMAIASSKPGEEFNYTFEPKNRQVPPDLEPRSLNDDDRRFAQVAFKINDQLKAQVDAGATGALAPYQGYFSKEIAQNGQIIGMGYAYTGANNAFLSQVEADFLTTPPEKLDGDRELARIDQCLSSLADVTPNENNLEWVAGAHARAAWTGQKVKDITENNQTYHSSEEKYLAIRELYYAQSWCEAASYLLDEARSIDGKPLNQSALAGVAAGSLQAAQESMNGSQEPDADAAWHLMIANDTLSGGDYLASIYDATYARAVQESADEALGRNDSFLSNLSQQLSGEEYSTLWGRTYQSQGAYIMADARANNRTAAGAYSIFRLARGMEAQMGGLKSTLANPPIRVQVGTGASAADRSGANGADGKIFGGPMKTADWVLLVLIAAGIIGLAVHAGRRLAPE